MKTYLTAAMALAVLVTPTLASAQEPRTVTSAEKQRLIAEAQEHNRALAEREKTFYASQQRLQQQLKEARASGDNTRYAELQKQAQENDQQRERQRAANAEYQQHIKNVYALKTKD
ncbi:hypothetical protein [Sphingomonas solaris]|uniref:DUF4398 domain-containing protein n=1 Tax=Alterirhizorhabdus solaris TaxID=2529389 RepID=A0A558RA38_9SPHN|nr:hypothetical protein [Sphingomonas solaris]TVV76246.1 hypothetical protein FOY91_04900 [Sphingomonas solaris]